MRKRVGNSGRSRSRLANSKPVSLPPLGVPAMKLQLKPLAEQVIVITGGSSGIGLATARAAVKAGAKVVLAARNGDALARIERELSDAGGEAAHVVADVAIRDDVEEIAAAAMRRFGGFDTWVNNAGVGMWGLLEEASDEDSRRLFETNFWGVVNGSLVALRTLRSRGGALINMGSVVSDVSFPIQGMYCASKHAVKGFTDSLREELLHDNAPVSVTLIKPAAIDTPFPRHARNYFDKEPKLPPPVYRPEDVAGAVLHAATHQTRDLFVGGAGVAMAMLGGHAPRVLDWMASKAYPQHFRDEPATHKPGALHAPAADGDTRGGHPGVVLPSAYTWAATHPWFALGIASAVGVAAVALAGGAKKA